MYLNPSQSLTWQAAFATCLIISKANYTKNNLFMGLARRKVFWQFLSKNFALYADCGGVQLIEFHTPHNNSVAHSLHFIHYQQTNLHVASVRTHKIVQSVDGFGSLVVES